ncbi:hypothetical protein RUM43_002957 [Polyplax serrata]|uniref:Uncharacterized protein n=1 Tax=Polyplax serrata TaxID=468196 RepID=A0AAN8P2T1_POLSC
MEKEEVRVVKKNGGQRRKNLGGGRGGVQGPCGWLRNEGFQAEAFPLTKKKHVAVKLNIKHVTPGTSMGIPLILIIIWGIVKALTPIDEETALAGGFKLRRAINNIYFNSYKSTQSYTKQNK